MKTISFNSFNGRVDNINITQCTKIDNTFFKTRIYYMSEHTVKPQKYKKKKKVEKKKKTNKTQNQPTLIL